jgi:AraC family transcriptional regulator, arabinose operon regulatory protein
MPEDGPNLTVLTPHRSDTQDGPAPQMGTDSEGARKIDQSIAYMMRHLDRPLQISELAQTAHISPSHFFALFKRWTGFSPIDYFIGLRMHHAGRLLTGTNMSVKETAAALGYDDPFYFSRVFKLVHGMAPRDFRLKTERNHSKASEDAPLKS